MTGVISKVTDAVGLTDSDAGAGAARDAAAIQAQYQREALNYLKDREALPQQYREGALDILGGLYGLNAPSGDAPPRPTFQPMESQGGMFGAGIADVTNQVRRKEYEQELADWERQYGGPGGTTQQQAMETLQGNPIFQATLGNLPQQEQAILRNQSATGALRGGGTDLMLAQNQRQNQLQAYQNTLGGLQGLANLPSNAGQIAQGTANIGQTMGQGIIGAAQSQQAANQAGMGNLMGLGQLGLSAFQAGAFCDPALKDNVEKIGELEGYNIYHWTWNDKAASLDLYGEGVGPMADEVEAREPERVTRINGYKFVRARNGY